MDELSIRLLWLNAARNVEERAWVSLGVPNPPHLVLVWRRVSRKLGQGLSKERSN